ncbi:carboxypeptidase regulatory-like domain-containing protein [Natrinema sp. 1APR25-10V2]|uniref:carboxypeptidase regulatory-like domain-containing protein n=1 Tax=Natrinema sp. 1APR25-10V2 TaxID=2951081 RepID=UPI0028769A43|nr:carboxypeptidase regulatory-like domain-containing protein [Natrinema sp. 1APR25-10V2]MDS0477613.1 carboxypeptidase regulatory-like domain-containing protein [Natrinema sp. 1APR25-10V2]
MRRNVRRQQTKTRSIQRSVQLLLILSGIAFLLAGLVLAASGASVTSAFGAVDDRLDDSSQPADDGAGSTDGDAASSGNESAGATNETDGGGENSDSDGGGTGSDTVDSGGDDSGSENDSESTPGDETHVLTAVVETENGQPIDNATVSVDSGGSSSDERAVDGTGEAEFERTNGEYTVTASADGYESAERTVQLDGADETVTLTLTERSDTGGGGSNDDGTHSLAVTVADQNGSPITNATVELRDESGLFASSETKTVGGNGTAVFERENGEYTIVASADGYGTAERTVQLDGSDEAITVLLDARDG